MKTTRELLNEEIEAGYLCANCHECIDGEETEMIRFCDDYCEEKYNCRMPKQGYLILTRRVSEAIMIGDNIEVMVLGIKGMQVRLGFKAPKEVVIHRAEIYERIQRDKAAKEGNYEHENN